MTQAIVPKELLTATPGGLSLLVVSGGVDGQVLTLQANGTYAPANPSSGSGDVVGPSSATDNAVARFDTTTGKVLQNGVVTIGDTGNIAGLGTVACGAITATGNISTPGSINGTSILCDGSTVFDTAGFRLDCGVGGGFNTLTVPVLLQLGGTTSAFPAVKRSGTTVAFRLANDSADASVTAAAITASELMCCGVYTFATVPSASSNTGKFLRISDRSQKHAYSDGTNWRFFGDDAVIS